MGRLAEKVTRPNPNQRVAGASPHSVSLCPSPALPASGGQRARW